tara:strand:+ start:447 stop:1232 length:786 start_codon:yes stop_codon:yes gene_type:complete
MKKTLLFLILIATPSVCHTQELNDWQIGINMNPFFFTRINSEYQYYVKDSQDVPNGFGYGLTIEKNWNAHWGIKTGFENTKQNEKYYFDENSADNTKIKMAFEYYKFPITIQYYYPLKEKLFLTFNQGLQFSSLKYFKTIIKSTSAFKTFTSNYAEFIFYEHPENNGYNPAFNGNGLHNDFLYGIIGSIGLKGFITDKISYATNVRYEYDIKSADNNPYYSTTPGGAGPEGTTHNLRVGLEFGLQYHFLIGDRFDKRAHKL